jgi:hypothetical protein
VGDTTQEQCARKRNPGISAAVEAKNNTKDAPLCFSLFFTTYICVYIYIYIYTHIYVLICIYTYIHTDTSIHTNIREDAIGQEVDIF